MRVQRGWLFGDRETYQRPHLSTLGVSAKELINLQVQTQIQVQVHHPTYARSWNTPSFFLALSTVVESVPPVVL